MSTTESRARYLANPRQCVGCGGVPAAGMPRCWDCHKTWIEEQSEGMNP